MDPRDQRATRLPDTPPLGLLGYGVLGAIVALAMAGRALDQFMDPRPLLYLARSLRFRRLR